MTAGRPTSRGGARWAERLGILVAALASVATSRPMLARNYPMWETRGEASRTIGCATLRTWVSKSGKEGAGVSVEVLASAAPCTVSVSAATLRAGDSTHPGVLPEPVALAQGETRRLYIAFPFDNERSWNDGVRLGDLALSVQAGGAVEPWVMPLVHRHDSFHKSEVHHPSVPPSGRVMDRAGP